MTRNDENLVINWIAALRYLLISQIYLTVIIIMVLRIICVDEILLNFSYLHVKIDKI